MIPLILGEEERAGALAKMLEGILAAQPGQFYQLKTPFAHTLYRREIPETNVSVIVSGGGGCGPLFLGFVGKGLADAACEGDFDCAPSAYALYELAKVIHRGRGVLFLTNNYTGDFLNNDMAQELLQTEGIDSRICYINDDIFSASGEPPANRGGMCAIGIAVKIAAAAAGTGMDLDAAYSVTRHAVDRMRSVTVCYNAEKKSLEFGAGFSGEEPRIVVPYTGIESLSRQVRDIAMKELSAYNPREVYFIVDRMKLLTYLEGLMIMESLKRSFEDAGCRVAGCASAEYFSAFTGPGCIVSVAAVDGEFAEYMPVIQGCGFTI